MHRHRRVLFGAAALVLPIAAVAVLVATSGTALAREHANPKPTITAQSCQVSSSVQFASPGLSILGATNTSKTSNTTTGTSTLSGSSCGAGGGGTIASLTITTKSTKCTGDHEPAGTACSNKKPTNYDYDGLGAFGASATTLWKDLKKLPAFETITVGSDSYTLKAKASTAVAPGGVCGNYETGYDLTGTAKQSNGAKGTFSLTICLGTDTDQGPNTTGSFAGDIGQMEGDTDFGLSVQSAVIDGTTALGPGSVLSITS